MAEGVSFEDITNYVRSELRMTEAKVAERVAEVLTTGVALGRIIRTPAGGYRLVGRKPPGLACKIKEMKISDDSDSSGESSNGEF